MTNMRYDTDTEAQRHTSTQRKAHTDKEKHIDTGTSASALETSG